MSRSEFRPTRSVLALLAAFALIAGACSGGDDDSADEATTTTEAVEETTTTTEVDEDDDETTTTSEAAPLGPVAPLTGLPVNDEDELDRPALAVKIDNHPRARPQTGIDLADIVFEVRAEGVTRFMAVFHSEAPAPVGPVRSSRTSDFDLLSGLDRPLYASSGGNDNVMAGVRNLDIQAVTNASNTEYFRDGSRPAPHNLYVNAEDLWAVADEATAPEAWFEYRRADDDLSPSAEPIEGPVTIAYKGEPVVTHTWDDAEGGWLRTQNGLPHTTVTGDQLAPENVVIMVTTYGVSSADITSPEVVSVGSGQLFVLTDGHVLQGTWTRPAADEKPVLIDSSGSPIALSPGRTWVLMPDAGAVTLPIE